MKHITKIAAICLMAVATANHAQQSRIETPISTGPGGFTLIVSTPAVDGPFDFARNKGPKVNTINGDTYGELMFLGGFETTGSGVYQVSVYRDDKANERNKPYSADVVANNMIKDSGFVGKAVKFNCPRVEYENLTSIACYRMQGVAQFGKNIDTGRSAVTVVAVSLKNNTQAFAFVGKLLESDTKKFDTDPSYAIKFADGAAAGMLRNSHLK